MINTITLNSINYSTSANMTIDNDVLDTGNFIIVGGQTYYANKHVSKGVSKNKRKLSAF